MNYVKIKSATISDDGTSMEVSFKDEHSCSQMTITVPALEWLKGVTEYSAAYHEKWTEIKNVMEGLQMSMSRYVYETLSREKVDEKRTV